MRTDTLTPFQQALLDVAQEHYAHVPPEHALHHAFSPRFEAWARKLIRKTKNRTWHYTNTALKRAVIVAVLAALLVTTVLATPSLRQAVIDFFTRHAGTHFTFDFTPEDIAAAPDTIEQVYMPGFIPEGFEVLEDGCINDPYTVTVVWVNGENDQINYSQKTLEKSREHINAERTDASRILLDGYEVFYSEDSDFCYYVWTDRDYFFRLICPKELGEDAMREIFRSIHPIAGD